MSPSPLPRRRRAPIGALLLTAAAGCAACSPAPTLGGEEAVADTTDSGIAWSRRGTGPVVVLIHGTNLDRRVWGAVAASLSADHSVIAYDLRSHGASADAAGPWSDEDDLTGVLSAAGVGSATLVGLSAGAGIALEYALEHPDRVDGLVLVSPSVRGFRPAPDEVPDVFGPLMAALSTGDTLAVGDALLELPTFVVDEGNRETVEAQVRSNLRLFRVDPAWARLPASPPLERLGTLSVATSILVGTDDFAATRRLARELAEGIADAEVAVLPDAPHLLPLTHPDAVVAAIRARPPTRP